MQLFRSEWLREPWYAHDRNVRASGLVPRYGLRIDCDAPAHRRPACAPEPVDVPAVVRERAVLWEIARYERAA